MHLKQKLKFKTEFKFVKSYDKVRDEFFETIKDLNFRVRVVCVEKVRIESPFLRNNPKKFYNFFLKSKGFIRGEHMRKAFLYYCLFWNVLGMSQETKIEELKKELEDTRRVLEEYKKLTVNDIWLSELDDFMESYEKWLKEWEEEKEKENSFEKKKPSKKSKKITKP